MENEMEAQAGMCLVVFSSLVAGYLYYARHTFIILSSEMALGSAGALQNNHTHRCLRGIISVALFTMPATSTPLPSGVTAPLIADNDRNHGGLIVVLSSFSLFLVLASLAVRVYAAYMRHVVQMKDYVFGIAVVWFCSSDGSHDFSNAQNR